jgi:hypothetical protein
MSVETVELWGVTFDVCFSVRIERDPLGIGNSPTEYEISIESVEVGADTQDISEFLSSGTLDALEEAVFNQYLENK